MGIKDYVLLRLTGILAADESIASATGLYGLAARDWDGEALALAGLRRDQLPTLRSTTDVVTRLGPDAVGGVGAARRHTGDRRRQRRGVGEPRGGGRHPGVVACSIGTSGAIRGVVAEPRVDEQGSVFCYVLVPGRWVVGGATNNGGNVLRWLGRVIGADLADPDEELTELAATVPPGAEGLLMLPYLAGERAPRWSGDPYGALLGLTQRHGRAHLARAALEGVCLQLRLVLDAMQAAGSSSPSCGPPEGSPTARSGASSWRTSWVRPSVPGRAPRGPQSAPPLGHVALGHLPSVDEAAALVRVNSVVHPDPDDARLYRRLSHAYAATGEAVELLRAWRFDEAAGTGGASGRAVQGR